MERLLPLYSQEAFCALDQEELCSTWVLRDSKRISSVDHGLFLSGVWGGFRLDEKSIYVFVLVKLFVRARKARLAICKLLQVCLRGCDEESTVVWVCSMDMLLHLIGGSRL